MSDKSASGKKSTFLVTGTMGCIGAWVLRNLVNDGHRIIATDLDTTITRPALLLEKSELDSIVWEQLDVTDQSAVMALFDKHNPTHVIHLAGLQIPFCKADPALGASVNVLGTINMFEAVRKHNIAGFTYASSLAVMGPAELYPERPIMDDAMPMPVNLYGVYKTANENTAKVYWQDWQVGSVGLRPYTVYGVCRDQGLTADLAKAVLAIAANEPFHIRFDGAVTLQHASDVAKIFIDSALSEHQGAGVFNLRNDVIEVAEFVATLNELYPDNKITFEKNAPLPFPADMDDSGLQSLLDNVSHTDIQQAIQADVELFKQLLASGQLDTSSLV